MISFIKELCSESTINNFDMKIKKISAGKYSIFFIEPSISFTVDTICIKVPAIIFILTNHSRNTEIKDAKVATNGG